VTNIKLYICCNGNADSDGFTYCKSCANEICDFSKLDLDEDTTTKLYNFLDNATGLFDGPVINHNKSFNIINLLHKNFGLFEEKNIVKIQYFFKMHKDCGVFIELIPE
jgi:hypothetical protein